MESKTLSDLFQESLRDIYDAEQQILQTLPKLAKAARSDDLHDAFRKHEEQTRGHVQRLEQVFSLLGQPARRKRCEAIRGILAEGDHTLAKFRGSDANDDGLIASGQAVEHYEIARYGTLKSWAEQLGLPKVADLLGQTLREEEETDRTLETLEEQLRFDDAPRPRSRSATSDQRSLSVHAADARDRQGARSGDRQRDERGRVTDDNDRGRPRALFADDHRPSPSDDERQPDRERGYHRSPDDDRGGQRGWFGDSEGHAEAARRGWEDRQGEGRSSYRGPGDEERHRSRSREDESVLRGWSERDNRSTSRRDEDDRFRTRSNEDRGSIGDDREGGHGGWFGDPERHSEASRRGWENPRHRESGWFGDPEGHAEASRRGWEGREDDRPSSGSRSRDDERSDRSRSR